MKPSDVEGIFVIMHLIENLSLLGRDSSFYLKFTGIAFVYVYVRQKQKAFTVKQYGCLVGMIVNF
jgi:hypothetical protein